MSRSASSSASWPGLTRAPSVLPPAEAEAAAFFGLRPRFFPVYAGLALAAPSLVDRFRRRLPDKPSADRVLLTSVLLIPPFMPADRHASFTAAVLPSGWSCRYS